MKWCFVAVYINSLAGMSENRKIWFSSVSRCLPVTFWPLSSNTEPAQEKMRVPFLLPLTYILKSWKKIFSASEESNMQERTVVWEICIFSARIFSSTVKELAKKCRILSLNEHLGGFSESPNDLVPLRRAKILWKMRCLQFLFSALDRNKAACRDHTVRY